MSRTAQILIAVLVVTVLLFLMCVGGYLAIRTIWGEQGQVATTATPVEDTSWQRVRAAGVLVVGTSADYPPFEYMANATRIDGFDIALMDEIGRRLGVQIEYRNIAFDGLFGALQVGQIDAAIAAISTTPDRQAIVDFSTVYLVGMDGILARDDSDIRSINAVGEMANQRIGVQSGTVYETWLQTALVETGQMPASDLSSFEQADEALASLEQGRVDLVVLDLPPAEAAAEDRGLRLVGQGLNVQHYAIALPKGAAALKAEIDRALAQMYEEGAVDQLAKLYLDLDLGDLLPTPAPAATSTPAPVPDCVDAMAFVQHVDSPGDPLSEPPVKNAGQDFAKVWRVRNTGTCTWNGSYRVVYASGNATDARMGGQPVSMQREVPPGQEYDIELNLVAPQKTGTYVAYWQMENDKGQAFGERLPVAITVVLAPTATPSPGINFSVDRTQIKAGECVVFEWRVENVSQVFFYPEGERWQDNGVSGQGSQRECPAETTTFDLRVVRLDESVEVRQITVNVEAVAPPPIISQFLVQPSEPIEQGDCVNITWGTTGSIDRVTIWSNDFTLWEGAPLQGSLQDCPAGPGTVTYRLEVEGPGGSNGRQQSIDILGPPTETPVATSTATPVSTLTPGPAEPVIDAFTVEPPEIAAGDCVSIAWSTSGGTSWVTITADDVILQDNAPLEGNLEHCPQAPGSVEYEIIAYNAQDQTSKQQQSVTVTEGQGPANPLAGTSWLAIAYYDPGANGMVTVLPGTSLTADFDPEDGLVGSGGCNDYRARYQVEDSNLAIDGVSAGRTLCSEPEGIMEQEAQFLGHLEAATTLTLEGNQLRLAGSGGQTLLEFEQP